MNFTPQSPKRTPPVNRIPTELLAKIFFHYVAFSGMVWPARCTPVTLSHVCQHWRRLTLTFPTLWSSIFIQSPSRGDLSLVKLWLDRSRSCPLSIHVRTKLQPTLDQSAWVNPIFEVLCAQAHRWSNIEMLLRGSPPPVLMDIPHGSLTSLESVKLDVQCWDIGTADLLLSTFFSARSLRRVNWGHHPRRIPPQVPWHQLTQIHLLSNSTPQELLNILGQCVHLEKVYIGVEFDGYHHLKPQPLVILSNLRTLEMITHTKPDSLFDYLALPALINVKLNYHPYPGFDRSESSRIPTIQRLLHRSSCDLRRFAFTDDSMEEDDLQWLLAIPQLAKLTVYRVPLTVTHRTMLLLTHPPLDIMNDGLFVPL
ncbi:hypothetical protein BD779DRAFT_1670233 [Infundibulicybe gibba]|nr:hypothetical protein BD779DRAFT_1670233 [Infundibulicybe gibba]